MQENFKVSIIIPVYNAEEHIKDTLRSIENQTFKGKIEVLLINDGSEDNSISNIEDFMVNNQREYSLYFI